MVSQSTYLDFVQSSMSKRILSNDDCLSILNSSELELISILNAAYQVRKRYTGKEVTIHVINNAQNGFCPEDCKYCAQAKTSESPIQEYPIKTEEEILEEAKNAYEKGAHRYCMVFAGRGPSQKRVEFLASIIKRIKSQYSIEVCVSPGILDAEKAGVLKEAGLDRLNHNLNTSESNYSNICSTHTFEDRLNTLRAAKSKGLQLCSGVIIGMNETDEDVIKMALTLREMRVESIPVNFLIPVQGSRMDHPSKLNPEYCLRVLCLFRFLNPTAEIRVAAGREIHLRSMEVMSLYPANSLFLDGYLNVKGNSRAKTLQMIKDAGFTIKSDQPIDDLIKQEQKTDQKYVDRVAIKDIGDLRPEMPAV